MTVTDEMVLAAVKKAVEAGLLPRHACREDGSSYRQSIQLILQAAFELAPMQASAASGIFSERETCPTCCLARVAEAVTGRESLKA